RWSADRPRRAAAGASDRRRTRSGRSASRPACALVLSPALSGPARGRLASSLQGALGERVAAESVIDVDVMRRITRTTDLVRRGLLVGDVAQRRLEIEVTLEVDAVGVLATRAPRRRARGALRRAGPLVEGGLRPGLLLGGAPRRA